MGGLIALFGLWGLPGTVIMLVLVIGIPYLLFMWIQKLITTWMKTLSLKQRVMVRIVILTLIGTGIFWFRYDLLHESIPASPFGELAMIVSNLLCWLYGLMVLSVLVTSSYEYFKRAVLETEKVR